MEMKAYIEYIGKQAAEEIHFKKLITTVEDIALVIIGATGEDVIRYIPKKHISKITIYDLR